MTVLFVNQCGADSSFSVQYDGGQSGRTIVLMEGQSASLDISNLAINVGTSCWARAYVQGGPNHDSGDNFAFQTGKANVTYTLTGSVDFPSFSCSGC
jgi:hypothetical protein